MSSICRLAQVVEEAAAADRCAVQLQREGINDGGDNVVGRTEWLERDEESAIIRFEPLSGFKRQACLANATWPD
jgi:hypothetical protein